MIMEALDCHPPTTQPSSATTASVSTQQNPPASQPTPAPVVPIGSVTGGFAAASAPQISQASAIQVNPLSQSLGYDYLYTHIMCHS